jgi:hypothetical protein
MHTHTARVRAPMLTSWRRSSLAWSSLHATCPVCRYREIEQQVVAQSRIRKMFMRHRFISRVRAASRLYRWVESSTQPLRLAL